MERLTEKELTELQNLNTEFTKFKITIGDLEIQKSSIISEIAAIKMKFAQNEKKLIDKYGEDSVIIFKQERFSRKKNKRCQR